MDVAPSYWGPTSRRRLQRRTLRTARPQLETLGAWGLRAAPTTTQHGVTSHWWGRQSNIPASFCHRRLRLVPDLGDWRVNLKDIVVLRLVRELVSELENATWHETISNSGTGKSIHDLGALAH